MLRSGWSETRVTTNINRDGSSKISSSDLAIFVHIPKTGGSTLSSILRDHYAVADRFDHDSYEYEPVTLPEISGHIRDRVKIVMGHYPYGVHSFFPERTPRYFTMLRDPIERTLSHYSFVRTYPGYEEVAHNKSFSEYLDLSIEAFNGQTGQLSGNTFGDLEQAKSNLRACEAVGVMERFDDSLHVLRRKFGWADRGYRVVNVTQNRLRREDLSRAELRMVEQKNLLDLELYHFANEILTKQLRMTT